VRTLGAWLWLFLAGIGCGGGEPPCAWEACACLGSGAGCVDESCLGAAPAVSPATQIVPSAGLPREAQPQDANNNLDVVVHDGRLFLAFRTAPSHFASATVELHVVSTCDEITWEHEWSYTLGTDLREPRLLSFDGRLFLYFAVLGDSSFTFEPKGMMVTERLGHGRFTEPEWFYQEEFIPWRAKVVDGVPYLLAYNGGGNIYSGEGAVLEVHWLTTANGRDFVPVVPDQPVVLKGGTSETDFVKLDDGTIVAVSRNEEGDDLGWGSKICRAEAATPGDWQCRSDPKKYDSPLLFRHGSGVFLIGRRHLSETGDYDLGLRELSHEQQTQRYQLDYWNYPKRCSVWQVDPVTLEVTLVLDLPSKGDTCFPTLAELGDGHYRIYNYSSPLEGEDVDWVTGQVNPTRIYAVTLELPVG